MDSVKRAHRRRLDVCGPFEKIVIQSNEVNACQLPPRSFHESRHSSSFHGAEKLDA